MDDDEAFARRLQQQLLDEERMLMEQQQQQSSSAAAAATATASAASAGFPSGHDEEFDDHAYAMSLQQEGFDKPEEDLQGAVKATPAPSGYRISQMGPACGHPASATNQQQQQQHLASDAEFARRLQAMEAMGREEVLNAIQPPPELSNFAATMSDRRAAQEEEDARLARLLAESGESFRNLDLAEALTRRNEAEPVQQDVDLRPSQYSTNTRSSSFNDAHAVGLSAQSGTADTAEYAMRSNAYEPTTPSYGTPSNRVGDSGRNPTQSDRREGSSNNAVSPLRQRHQSPSNSPFRPLSHPRQHPCRNGLDGCSPLPSFRERTVQVPTGPAFTANSINTNINSSAAPTAVNDQTRDRSNNNYMHNYRVPFPSTGHSADFDPSPLNRGPLGESPASATLKPAPNTTTSTPRREPCDLLPGDDVLLDVPTDTKKEKKKKGFMKSIFGGGERGGGKNNGSNPAPPERSHNSSTSGRHRGRLSPVPNIFGTPSQPDTTASESSTDNSNNNAQRQADVSVGEQGSNEMVVRFPIPKPVPRPADTIGAPKGPLPYSLKVSRDAPLHQEATIGRRPQLGLPRNSTTCCVCRQPSQNPLTALDKKYHKSCFCCTSCGEFIDPSGPFAFVENNGDKQPMHRDCYSNLFGIKCVVCCQAIPAGPNGKISYVKHPFFDTEQMCPKHALNMTRRCTGCHRFEPENEPFADLNDVGRCVCLACCRTVIVDSNDAQPIWAEVVEFFATKLNLPIWQDFREIPILVVGYNALNEQMNQVSSVHLGASNIMTRGLCLTEHQSGRRFRMDRMRFDSSDGSFVPADVEERGFTFFQVPDASKVNPDASVTAILCLSGLPHDLAASVLAHEATHAWIKLHPRFDFKEPIPPQVEEGCCQLVAHLFLNDGLPEPTPLENSHGTGPSDEKLRQYFKFSIETDDSEIYGDGYRKAAKIYSHIGIEALMSHVILYQQFPAV
jgi:Protein DA1/LIM domain